MTSAGVPLSEVNAPLRPPARQRFALAVILIVLLAALCAPFLVDPIAHDAPRPKAGIVDLSRWGPLTAPVELKGQWRLEWRSPPAAGADLLIKVPGEWVGARAETFVLPELGAGSYHLLVRGVAAGRHTLFLPRHFAATRVLVNGRVLSERSHFGLTAATSGAGGRSQAVTIDTDGAPFDLQIDVAAFHHRDNGIKVSPLFGLAVPMEDWIALDWMQSILLIATLLLLAVFGIVVFLFRRQERPSLYFGLACLTLLPFAAVVAHDNLLGLAMPSASFNTMLTLQFLTTAAAVSFALAYVRELYPRETPRWVYWLLQSANSLRLLAYAFVALSGDTVRLSQISQLAAPLRTLAFVFMLGVIVAACVRRREGAWVFFFGLGSFVAVLIYSDLVNNASLTPVFGTNVVPLGSLLLLFSQLLILAERWSAAIDTSERTNIDLRRLLDVNISISSEMQLETLLKKIVTVTTKVVQAERSSLFLYDERRNELASAVAEGVQAGEIRFPADSGLAGWCFTHGEAVNLKDAYSDPRFNQDVDRLTGYRTTSVLTVPITTRDGRRVGVMQALNHQDSSSFGESDVERTSAFAAQAAIAIDNATLFDEVATERNYNESILRSMSSGVITLDREARVAKLNEAACRILGISMEEASGAGARRLLSGPNAWLMDEIKSVSESGRPKTLLDADVRTARGDTVSANLSIVPLLTESDQAGLLILVEDITEGKRLQGAMRRFMTQEVVDQIMGRDDELLFGSACHASVLFADIRNFTSLAEQLKPRDTVDMLNEIFTDLFEAVAGSNGVLDKFIGDAIMAVYGAPLSSGRDALNAVESAITMAGMIVAINARRRARGQPDISLGIGVATGELVAGTIGSPKRMDYTVIGDCVNLASRLEAITKVYGVNIVICEDTAREAEGIHTLRDLDTIRVRGRQRPARIFQVVTDDRPLSSAALQAYATGRHAMADGRWEDAIGAFETAIAAAPEDSPAKLMLGRVRILARAPPPADWDGVWESLDASRAGEAVAVT